MDPVQKEIILNKEPPSKRQASMEESTYPPEKLCVIFRCKTCRSPFFTRQKLHAHYRQSHNYVICHTCNATFGDRMYLQQHYNLTHKANKTFCVPCNIACKTTDEYTTHVKNVHPTMELDSEKVDDDLSEGLVPNEESNWTLECNVCNCILPSVEELMSHYNEKHKEKKQTHKVFHKCTICTKLFVTAVALVNHCKKVHNTNTSVKFTCATCLADFGTETSLNNHVGRVHRNKAAAKCQICSQEFQNYHILANHKKNVHSFTEKP